MRWPQQREAQRRGCTCHWWSAGTIAEFDDACPIKAEHRPREASKPNSLETAEAALYNAWILHRHDPAIGEAYNTIRDKLGMSPVSGPLSDAS